MAIWNCFQWICVTLALSVHSAGYRHETRSELFLYPDESETTSDEPNITFYHQAEAQNPYRQWSRNRAERRDGVIARSIPEESRENEDLNPVRSSPRRTSSRTENGTLKIINITPTSHQNQRDEAVSALRDSIVFPEPAGRREFAPVVTDGCKEGLTLCLSVTNYPEQYIANLLGNSAEDLRHQLTVDELEPVPTSRIQEDPDEIELCTYREQIAYPQAALNKGSQWMMIINQADYKQGFRIEVCQRDHSPCHPVVSFRLGMEAYCKQKYVLRKMTAVNAIGQVVTDDFRLPSCCSCTVRYVDAFDSGRKKRDSDQHTYNVKN